MEELEGAGGRLLAADVAIELEGAVVSLTVGDVAIHLTEATLAAMLCSSITL